MDNLSEARAKALRKTLKPACENCKNRSNDTSSPLSMLITKFRNVTCPCQDDGVSLLINPEGKRPLAEKPVEEGKQHKTSPFTLRCVAAITGGKAKSKEELSGAFAKCNATKNKSDHDLDAEAKDRSGFKARKAEFVDALNSIKNKRKKSG